MNFIEAHKMVHNFAAVVGKGCEEQHDSFLKIENLPFDLDKDKLVSAFQIFIYHMTFFQTRTAEEYNQYYVLYQGNIDRFLPHNEILKIRQYSKIISNKNPIFKALNKEKIDMASKLYTQLMEKNSFSTNPYRIDEIFADNLGEMQEYRNELYKKIKTASDEKKFDALDDAIELFAKKTYEKADINYKNEYFVYFQNFDTMRNALNKNLYENYYLKYKDYIFSNR